MPLKRKKSNKTAFSIKNIRKKEHIFLFFEVQHLFSLEIHPLYRKIQYLCIE